MTTELSAAMHSTPNNSPTAPTQVKFTGTGSEYFGIWIVNILLSIITLGIYSAWAKVRTNQYFYGHTRVDGHSLHYLATPMQILVGRIIAVILFIAYSLLTSVSPALSFALTILVMLVAPYLIVRSLRFSLRMTSYRNVRFGFVGNYGAAFLHFVILPICAILTLGLALPWVLKKIDQFKNGNVCYGDRKFQVQTRASSYYLACAATMLVSIFGLIIWFGVNLSIVRVISGSEENGAFMILPFATSFAITLFLYSILGAVYGALVRNHLFNHTSIEAVGQLHSNVRVTAYCWLLLSNTVLTLITLGIAYPWTKVRKTVFLANATQVTIEPGIESVLETLESDTSAFGEEAAGFFDVDVSLG